MSKRRRRLRRYRSHKVELQSTRPEELALADKMPDKQAVGEHKMARLVPQKPQQRQRIIGVVATWLMQHPGETMYIEEFGRDRGFTKVQVQGALAGIRERYASLRDGMVTVVPGHAYMYRPNSSTVESAVETVAIETPVPGMDPKPAEELFRLIGKTKDEALVLESESGTLYRAVEL